MKDFCTSADCEEIRKLIVNKISGFARDNRQNYVLLSGGIDSAAVLFAVINAGLPYKVINFKFRGRDSIDAKSVKQLQRKIGFDAEYLELEPDNEADIKKAVAICLNTFSRVRKVKCETIYAMLQVARHIPHGATVFCGYGGDDLFGYSRKDALLAARQGQECDEILQHRMLPKDKDEFRAALTDYRYYSPYVDSDVQSLITKYTTSACNDKFPKSIIVRAFGDYFKKYKNARKPIGLHKGSCEAVMFEDIARERGYSSALQMFNTIAKAK